MKAIIVCFSLLIAFAAHAGEFARRARFESVAGFVAAAKGFEPAKAKGELAEWFSARQTVEPADDKPVVARQIESASELWANESHALVFVTAEVPTEYSSSAVGVLFLLIREKGLWRVADTRRFTAGGLYAGVRAELTADAGAGYKLASESMKPVVTITKSHGGRGYGYRLSASYTFDESKLKRLDLE